MSLISELRHRKVFRIAMIYAVAAWGVLQAADVLAPLAGLPDWFLRVVLLALVLGFPIAMVLAWMFKLTPTGLERDDTALAMQSESAGAPPSAVDDGPGSNKTIAVLPFRNLGDGDGGNYLADGLTEELLSALKDVALRIPPNHPCCRCDEDEATLRHIASALPISHVIAGTMQESGDRLRMSVELIDVHTGARVWSQRYDSPRRDLVRLRDDIVHQVKTTLGADLAHTPRPLRRREHSPEAYTAFLKGRHAVNRSTAPGCIEAIEHFDEALAADPSMARAHAGIANAYWWLASYGSLSPEEGFPRARAAAQRALVLDAELAEAHLALAQVLLSHGWDFDGAEAAFRRALELEPMNAEVRSRYGHFLQMMGRYEEAVDMRSEAVRLDPLSLRAHLGVADSLFCAGSLQQAWRELDRIAELDPNYPVHHLRARIALARGRPHEALDLIRRDTLAWRRLYIGAIAHHRLGESDRAHGELRELIESHGDSAALQIALVYSQMDEKDRALSWLERAYQQRDPGLIELRADPELAPLRAEERFRSLEQRVGFAAPAVTPPRRGEKRKV